MPYYWDKEAVPLLEMLNENEGLNIQIKCMQSVLKKLPIHDGEDG